MSDTTLKAVLFDMDGVIVDSEPIYNQLFKYWLRDYDIEPDDDFYEKVMGGTWQVVFEEVNRRYDLKVDPSEQFSALNKKIIDRIVGEGIPLMEGAADAIEKLQGKYELALVSSSAGEVVERMLKHHGVYDFFSHVTTFGDFIYPKPHPQPYAITMAAMGVAPEECIVIEDSLNGTKAGLAAGAFVYGMPDPRIDASKYDPDVKLVYHFADILHDLL